jgi:ABC-type transport system substrate-binding protein
MNRFTRLAVVSAALSVVALACAGEGIAPSADSAATTQPSTTEASVAGESEIVIGVAAAGAPRTLNPLLDSPDVSVLEIIAPAVFAAGHDLDPETYLAIPDVLAEIPTIDNGGIVPTGDGTVTVEYRVAPDAFWADGTAITGSDLLFTYQLITDPSLPIRSDLRRRFESIIPGTAVADGRKLRIVSRPNPWLDRLFEVIVPRHRVEGSDFANDWNDRLWVSGGPFGFVSYEEGQFLELRSNPNYWKRDTERGRLPGLDRVVFRFFDVDRGAVDTRALGGFETEALDLVVVADAGSMSDALADLETLGARVVTVPSIEWEHLNFQFGPNNRNDDSLNRYRGFRRAVAHAIDRTRLADLTGGTPVTSVLREFLPDLETAAWDRYAPDVERVKGELFDLEQEIERDLFEGNGPRLVLTARSDDRAVAGLAGEVVRMLDEAGIGAELQLEDESVLFGTTLDNGSWDVGVWSFAGGAGLGDAAALLSIFDPEGLPYVGDNFFRWGTIDSLVDDGATARYAGLVDRIATETDPAELRRLVVEAEALLAEEVVLIPLVHRRMDAVAWWPDRIEGPIVHPRRPITWNMDAWIRPAV